jgi:uncharacterized protein YndB with AHSA1/START domain
MIKKVGLAVVVLVAIILVLAAIRPGEFKVERSVSINAPAERIFPLINGLHNWSSWSPYEKLDPAMKRTLSGPAEGVGAAYEWEGNNKVGAGRMEITKSTPPSSVGIALDMLKPMAAHHDVEFNLESQGDATKVSWSMQGKCPYHIKVISLFVNMDKMVGRDFEEGLANLKNLVEKGSEGAPKISIVRTFDAPVDEVWQAWTDPAKVKQWWGPKGFTAPSVKNDLRVGGTYLYSMKSPDGKEYWSTGTYREIVPQKKIVVTDSFADKTGKVVPASEYGMEGEWPLETTMTVTFDEASGKTALTLEYSGVPAGKMSEMAKAGWNESLDKLGASLKR